MTFTRSGRVPTLLGAVFLAGGILAPAAEAADTLSILSVTPSTGAAPIVLGGDAATAASLNPSNHVVARVVFPSAASYEKVNFIWVGATSIPATAPPGKNVPRFIVKPFQKAPVTGRGPVRYDVEFGWACYPNNMHEITLTQIKIAGLDSPAEPASYVVGGTFPTHLVITCPEAVSPKPPVRGVKP